jgi:RNA polymerase sigma-70 factor (ECF subfamily)
MKKASSDTEVLLDRASGGDPAAVQELLTRFRARLNEMVRIHMDHRLAARVDPSDVVQDTFARAWRELPDYLSRRPLPFYPWLREFAWKILIDLRRKHILAQRRSVNREDRLDQALPDQSAMNLARKLLASGTSPSHQFLREEMSSRIHAALSKLEERDSEVLVLRHLEQLSTIEIAAVLKISEGAVRVRHLRAMQRFREVMGRELLGEEP